jgi:predicted DNA binding CopG/RHH family protein
MSELSRTTIYLKPALRRALKVKAALTDQSVSDLVNDAVRQALRAAPAGKTRARARRLSQEDAADLAVVRQRRREKGIPYKQFLKQLKDDGLL